MTSIALVEYIIDKLETTTTKQVVHTINSSLKSKARVHRATFLCFYKSDNRRWRGRLTTAASALLLLSLDPIWGKTVVAFSAPGLDELFPPPPPAPPCDRRTLARLSFAALSPPYPDPMAGACLFVFTVCSYSQSVRIHSLFVFTVNVFCST